MRNLLLFCSVIILAAASCTKEDLPAPAQNNLPVVFSSFSASSQNGKVILQFTTSEEKNLQYFKIFSGDNGSQLCVIAQLTATGNNNHSHTYLYEDDNPKGNPAYYMIGYVAGDSTLSFNDQMLTVNIAP